MENYSQVSGQQTFNLLVTCVRSIAPSSSMASIDYFIGDAQIATLIPAYNLSPSDCPIELVYSVTMDDDTALASQFTLDKT